MKHRTLKLIITLGVIASVPAAAFAATDADPAETFTACLGTSGANNGKLMAVGAGTATTRACNADTEKKVHLGSGDVTSIKTEVGGGITLGGRGLTGGVYDSGGQVEVNLGKNYKLPQTCSTDQLVKKTTTGWGCKSIAQPPGKKAILGQARGEGIVGNDWSTIGGPLTLPAGVWALTSKSNFKTHQSSESEIIAECRLDVTGHAGLDYGDVWIDGMVASGQINLNAVVAMPEEFHAAMVCKDYDISNTDWWGMNIMAIQVDTGSVVNL